MSEPIYEDPAGRTGAYYVLSLGEAEACAMMGVDEETYLGRRGGRVKYLADRRVRLSAAGDDGAARRRIEEGLAHQLGVSAEELSAERVRQGRRA